MKFSSSMLSSLVVALLACESFGLVVRTPFPQSQLRKSRSGQSSMTMFFGGKKKEPELLNPVPEKKPSIWTASVSNTADPPFRQAAKKKTGGAAGKKKTAGLRVGASSGRSAAARGKAVVDPYSGGRGGGNYGRDDFLDVTNQDEAGLLPDWLAGFFYDKSVGGPQRDLESIVATQLFFATFVLTPVALGAMFHWY